MRSNIRESAAFEVSVAIGRIVVFCSSTDVIAQVGLDGVLLIPGPREVEAETAAASIPSMLWVEELCTAYCCHVRTGAWELRRELRFLRASVRATHSSNALIASRFEDCAAADTHHPDLVADTLRIPLRDCIFVIAIGV